MTDLVSFLRARLDEDEAAPTPGRAALDDLRFELKEGDPYEQHLSSRIEDGLDIQTTAWEARVLREVAAKRAILDAYIRSVRSLGEGLSVSNRNLVRAVAAVYNDHPDYRQEWAQREGSAGAPD